MKNQFKRFNVAKIVTIFVVSALFANGLSSCTQPQEENKEDGQVLFVGDNIAIANTTYGKVQGFILRDIYNFRGIPYGASTAGKNRFMPPQKPEAWTNVRPTVFWGNSAPQDFYDRSAESFGAFVDHWNYDEVGEDCLRLNVWTPALADGKKRPVLVWLHGGGYSRGNGIEQDGYDGENFSRYGDVVFVSINHRLGAIGFSDLSSVGGEKYKNSGNVGLLDIVASLEWVRDNIANFGGDPANVTIAGQSGGGGKVCNVAAMPSAKNLINKGVSLSGSAITAIPQSYSQKLGEYIVKEAGLKPSEIDQLQELPWNEYMDITNRALKKFTNENTAPMPRRGGFGPVADGINLPVGTYFADQSFGSSDIPMLFCSTFHEWNPNRTDASLENITKEGVVEKLKPNYGDNAQAIVDAYGKNFPDKRPIELWALITSNRKQIVDAANAKLTQTSPVYMAWFGWESPLFDHRMRSFHCLDISFWFRNTDLMFTHTGGGERPRNLANKMSDAMLSFMRTGNPNCKALPEWPIYTAEEGATMILNDECAVKNDPDREARASITK